MNRMNRKPAQIHVENREEFVKVKGSCWLLLPTNFSFKLIQSKVKTLTKHHVPLMWLLHLLLRLTQHLSTVLRIRDLKLCSVSQLLIIINT